VDAEELVVDDAVEELEEPDPDSCETATIGVWLISINFLCRSIPP